jgi:putative colanic acid biosynthesis acetyltransferase WcaB
MISKIDLKANKGNPKSLIFICMFRISHFLQKRKVSRIIGFPIRLMYRIISRNILNLEIWDSMEIGEGFVIWHGAQSSVINPYTVIGKNVSLRQNTTLGSSSFTDPTLCPIIGDNVDIGPNTVVIGKIRIGDNSSIGAGSVVTKDVPSNAIVIGNPAVVIRYKNKY